MLLKTIQTTTAFFKVFKKSANCTHSLRKRMLDEVYMYIYQFVAEKKFNQFQMLFPPPIANFANTFVDVTIFAEGLLYFREKGLEYGIRSLHNKSRPIRYHFVYQNLFKRTCGKIVNHRLSSFTMDRGLAAQFVAPVPGPCK